MAILAHVLVRLILGATHLGWFVGKEVLDFKGGTRFYSCQLAGYGCCCSGVLALFPLSKSIYVFPKVL